MFASITAPTAEFPGIFAAPNPEIGISARTQFE